MSGKPNPRRVNGSRRTKLRNRVKARRDPCALCGRPIDYDLPSGDPWSYELDEIVPVSKGGNPFDINNVQPVHRLCNERRSNKSIEGFRFARKEKDQEDDPLPWSRQW